MTNRFTRPGRVRVPVLLHSAAEGAILAEAATRAGVSRSEYMRRAALDAAAAAPPSQDITIAIQAIRNLVRSINDMTEDLHQALDTVSDAAKIPADKEH